MEMPVALPVAAFTIPLPVLPVATVVPVAIAKSVAPMLPEFETPPHVAVSGVKIAPVCRPPLAAFSLELPLDTELPLETEGITSVSAGFGIIAVSVVSSGTSMTKPSPLWITMDSWTTFTPFFSNESR